MKKNNSKNFSFEKTMSELEGILNNIENKNLSLDQLVDNFERGSKLSNDCIEYLKNAKLKINKIIDSKDNIKIKKMQ